jgi:murein DD-endopeptidase MepM/ murein hydrolase activator NlpD
MRRYFGIFVVLLVLAWLYARIGGFGANPGGTFSDVPKGGESGEDSLTTLARVTPPDDEEEAAVDSLAVTSAPEDELFDSRSPANPTEGWESVTVGRGQSFYVAMRGAGIAHEDIMSLVKACKPQSNFRQVQAGASFRIQRNENEALTAFHSELDGEHYLLATRTSSGWKTEIGAYPLQRKVKGVKGVIESNLFDALVAEDANPQLATELSEILGWDIDFFRDLRKGDKFKLVYEEYSREGKRVRDGRILAATFTNKGHEFSAYLFQNKLGFPAYYDDRGGSLEKQFLRAPLKYSRISSNFSRHRLHPIDHVYRPHYGVDYAAPRGTPVYATANGTVEKRERIRGNGNYVRLHHGNGYETYYLHLSHFAQRLHVGQRVKQGDLIGYVGMTGKATAPHLDYRVKHNRKWLNPRKLDLPPAAPIEDERRALFMERREELRAELARIPGDENETIVLERETTKAAVEPAGR